jgi:hypothetical protein
MDLLRPGVPVGRRALAAIKVAAFYGRWYPVRLVGRLVTTRQRRFGRLAGHARYIERTTHRLAAALFAAMARHGQKLERRQVLLAHLMDIGTELFAMAATCAYARTLAETNDADGDPRRLADVFCHQSRARIDELFRAIGRGGQRRRNALARRVLDGDFKWMEQGIVPCGTDNEK